MDLNAEYAGAPTELHIKDLFEEVGRMVYVFWAEYEAWVLGHRTDGELGQIEHRWATTLETMNRAFEAEVVAHLQARQATRKRYLLQEERAAEEPGTEPAQPTNWAEFVRANDRAFTRQMGKMLGTALIGQIRPPSTEPSTTPPTFSGNRATWPLKMLVNCGCEACLEEVANRLETMTVIMGNEALTFDSALEQSRATLEGKPTLWSNGHEPPTPDY